MFLCAGSGTHAEQTAEVMRRFEPVLSGEKADALLVVGDVNSTLACALVAAKLPLKSKPVIAHVEAGLAHLIEACRKRFIPSDRPDLRFTVCERRKRDAKSARGRG